MKTVKVEPIRCEYCNTPMQFFDQAWPETKDVVIASLICTKCSNVSVVNFELDKKQETK